MKEKLVEEFEKEYKKKNLPEIKTGDLVRVYHKIKEGGKEKILHFEGVITAKKRKKEIGATITIRREISGIGVEKIFPLHSPLVEKIEVLKRQRVRRAKLYYLRKK